MMPVPTHLRGLAVARDDLNDEANLVANLRCPCGGTVFEVLHPGQTQDFGGVTYPCTIEIDGKFFFVVKMRCVSCSAEHVLLDQDFHGWDGFVCHDPQQAALPRPPLVGWACEVCGCHDHSAVVDIQTQGKEDFVSGGGEDFPPDRWPDGFGWLTLSTTCSKCAHTRELISAETM